MSFAKRSIAEIIKTGRVAIDNQKYFLDADSLELQRYTIITRI
jgi:hypothetical protein